MKIPFTKMHGCGNDYVYVNCLEKAIDSPQEFAKKVSHRRYGVGGDGLVLILPSDKADFRMRMFNADGSEAEMCGNGIRCCAKYVYDNKLTSKKEITFETGAGVLNLSLFVDPNDTVEKVRVDMGEPVLEGKKIPTTLDKEKVVNEQLAIAGKSFGITCVSLGNPHCVIFVPEITNRLVSEIGPLIEKHELFPAKINVEFVEIVSKDEVVMRIWERGSGETFACGTGASAVCVAGVLNGLIDRNVVVHLKGGDLEIEWNDDNHVYMTGPAKHVFEGTVEF